MEYSICDWVGLFAFSFVLGEESEEVQSRVQAEQASTISSSILD